MGASGCIAAYQPVAKVSFLEGRERCSGGHDVSQGTLDPDLLDQPAGAAQCRSQASNECRGHRFSSPWVTTEMHRRVRERLTRLIEICQSNRH